MKKFTLSALASILMMQTSLAQLCSTVIQPDAATGKDATISSYYAYTNLNFGNYTEILAMAWTSSGVPFTTRSLIQFDFSAIPANGTVTSAYLSLYNDPLSPNGNPPGQHSSLSGSNAGFIQKVTAAWDENTITWNNQPATSTTNQVIIPQSTSTNQNYDIDVTGLVMDAINNPASNFGFLIRLQDENYYRSLLFASSDNQNAALHPRLVVYYSLNPDIAAAGPTSFCSGGNVSLSTTSIPGFLYQWKRNGSNLTGATASSYTATTTGNYSVVVTNPGQCSGESQAISVSLLSAPSTPGVITGQAYGLCNVNGIPYSVQAVPGMTYNWSFNSTNGIVATGQGTNNITANLSSAFSTLNLTVTASNACGSSSARKLTLRSKPATPGAITGPLSVCANQQGVPYSIAPVFGAATYTWTGPKKSKISDGVVLSNSTTLVTSSNNVTVNYGNSGGTLKVRANNGCGSGAYKSVTVSINCREGIMQNIPEELEVSVYPNPVNTELTIQTSNNDAFEVILINAVGQQVLYSKNQTKIDVSDYTPGLYFIKIISGTTSVTRKIIVE